MTQPASSLISRAAPHGKQGLPHTSCELLDILQTINPAHIKVTAGGKHFPVYYNQCFSHDMSFYQHAKPDT